jgi:hypothetical protein
MRTKAGIYLFAAALLLPLYLKAASPGASQSGDTSAYTDTNSSDSDAGQPTAQAPATTSDSGDLAVSNADNSDGGAATQKLKIFNDTAGILFVDSNEIGKIGVNSDLPYIVPNIAPGLHHIKLVTNTGAEFNRDVTVRLGHNRVVHVVIAAADDEDQGADDDAAVAPTRSVREATNANIDHPERSYKGAKTACTILDWSGAVVVLGGLCVMFAGEGEEGAANKVPGYTSNSYSAQYYGYDWELPDGEWVPYSAYLEYHEGEDELDTGAGFVVVGLTCWLISACIPTHGPAQASLMNVQDHQFAWGVPKMDYVPTSKEMTTSLLTAKF